MTVAGWGGPSIDTVRLDHADAHVVHIRIAPGCRLHGIYLGELRLPHPASAPLVLRAGAVVVSAPDTRLRTGDDLFVLTTSPALEATERRLRAVSRGGRLAYWHGEYGDPDPPTRRPGWKSYASSSRASASPTRSSPATAAGSA